MVEQAIEDAELIESALRERYEEAPVWQRGGLDLNTLAVCAATLLLRPTDRVLIDVEFRQHEEGEEVQHA